MCPKGKGGDFGDFVPPLLWGREYAFSSQRYQIFKRSYHRNYCMDSNQILHTSKDQLACCYHCYSLLRRSQDIGSVVTFLQISRKPQHRPRTWLYLWKAGSPAPPTGAGAGYQPYDPEYNLTLESIRGSLGTKSPRWPRNEDLIRGWRDEILQKPK